MWDDSDQKSATFVWQKKLEKQGLKNLSRKELEALNRKKQQENVIELEKLKKRRLEREHQQQQREDDMYLMQRSKEVAQFEEWQRQEETFHLEQAKLRSKIRIQDGRAKPIDLLAQYISEQNLEESIEMQMHEPYTYLNGLGLDDLEDLIADIKVYNELEKGQNGDYWNDLTIIVEDELQKLRKVEVEKQRMATGRREGIHQSVAKDVTQIFKGKSSSQLDELKKKIEDKINSQQDGLDIGYWESLLSQLKAHMARARLRDRHQENLRNKLEMLKKEQESSVKKEEDDDPDAGPSGAGPSGMRKFEAMDETSRDSSSQSGTEQVKNEENPECDLLNECFELYKKGAYEPKYISEKDLEAGVEIVSEEKDDEVLDLLRQKVLGINQDDETFSKDEIILRKEAKRGMNDDEAEFSVESRVDSQVYLWSDKYRPRKPRYFNRVHTGFEWNKYNQTHYDMDNPPPKIKKLEKQGLKNLSRKELEALNRKKQQENVIELEKLKKRRLEREHQQQQREDDMYLMQRSKEVAQFEEWQRQEETFHLEQAKLRSKIRIQDGRAKPIDLLAQYISEQNLEESIEMQMHEPYTYLNGLGLDDLEDLIADIKVYNELEKGQNGDYWNDLTIIVEDELQKLRKVEVEKQRMATGRREGIHQSVAKDVTQIFKGKSSSQLDELKKKIEDKINSQQDGLDIGYWESLLSQLKAHMARARLRDRHQENLRNKLEMLKKEQESSVKKEEDDDPDAGPSGAGPSGMRKFEAMDETSRDSSSQSGTEQVKDEENPECDLLNECFELYKKGAYEPKYISEKDLEAGVEIVSEEKDDEVLDLLRQKVLGINQDDETFSKDEIILRKEAKRGMNDDEAEFSVESRVDSQVYLWSDKYRPRKPRYFNRVHTGFEWNKYNQTHYDMDNPPPKIVQGYKFNIFYPDLINKNSTPQYFLTPCADNPDFATLRFHAGPPYEDIAFKIVNREWEFSYKRGFRCQFHNNIFQLWFHFKRYRYRR
ncbi:hypothetical protein RP20_CCG020541 [Aedes albopictus]|nr:hypothetical protein RP20_CCG020541 [Aedes albopictus]